MNKTTEEVREYWNERAKELAGALAATTNDIHLRELEIKTVVETLKELNLPEDASVLDVGCGDGYSTLRVAREIEGRRFLGIDYSENMIAIAVNRLEEVPGLEGASNSLKDRVDFAVGDATKLDQLYDGPAYNVALTFRCLINLVTPESQADAIAQIAGCLKPGGYYVAIENFIEGNNNLNDARQKLGLPEIAVRWHNLFFKETDFISTVERFFEPPQFKDFSSSYYFATRVIYSSMCQMRGEVPDYDHDIHKLAIHLPWTGQFSPIRMAVMRKKAE